MLLISIGVDDEDVQEDKYPEIADKIPDDDDNSSCPESGAPSALSEIKEGDVELVINVSEGTTRKDEITSGYLIRRAAVDFGVSLVTNNNCAVWLVKGLEHGFEDFKAKSVSDFYSLHKY